MYIKAFVNVLKPKLYNTNCLSLNLITIFGVAGHAPVASRGKGDRADFRAVGSARALELAGIEPAVEDVQSILHRLFRVCFIKCIFHQAENLFLFEPVTQVIIEYEVVQDIVPDYLFGLLHYTPLIARREKFGAYWGIEDIMEYPFQIIVCRIGDKADQVAD